MTFCVTLVSTEESKLLQAILNPNFCLKIGRHGVINSQTKRTASLCMLLTQNNSRVRHIVLDELGTKSGRRRKVESTLFGRPTSDALAMACFSLHLIAQDQAHSFFIGIRKTVPN